MFKKLAQKLYIERQKQKNLAINPIEAEFDTRKHDFLNKLSKNALDMYERRCDIKNFTKLALSNPENDTHNKIMDELFSNGFQDPYMDKKLLELSDNSRFLRDLGLQD